MSTIANPAGRTVLLVEDDSTVRTALALQLTHLGYTVLEAASGPEAVNLLRQGQSGVLVALVDRRMPGMGGLETVAALRSIEPNVVCCLMTADSFGLDAEALRRLGVVHVLRKPFTLAQLAESLDQLARQPGGGG